MMRSDTGSYSVEVRDLVKRFGTFTAVDHISFKDPMGQASPQRSACSAAF